MQTNIHDDHNQSGESVGTGQTTPKGVDRVDESAGQGGAQQEP